MIRVLRTPAALTLALVLAPALAAADLSYHFEDGETFVYDVHNVVDPPNQGAIVSDVQYTFQASGSGPYGLTGAASGSATDYEIGDSTFEFSLTSDGTASGLSSPQLGHEIDGAFVKNAPGFFHSMPGEVAPGQSFEIQALLYAPKLDLPGSFTQLRTIATYTYQGSETLEDGTQVEVLTFSIREAPGQRQKLSVTGKSLFDTARGRVVSMDASGHLKVKVAFFWVTVPTSYWLREEGLAPPAPQVLD